MRNRVPVSVIALRAVPRSCIKLVRMSTIDILSLIDAEIANLQQARALLVTSTGKKLPGRPKAVAVPKNKPKRRMSAEGRARIAEAQRKRWAAKKK